MRYGLNYHNHQLQGDLRESTQAESDGDVASIVAAFYRQCIDYRNKTGLSQRLRWAYRYLTSDRPTHINFLSKDGDSSIDSDCEDCDDAITVNLDFIGNQFNIALSVYQDALKFRGSDYVTIDPTPVAEVSDEAKERIRRSSFNAIVREVLTQAIGVTEDEREQQLIALEVIHDLIGTDDGLAQVDEFIARQRVVETSKTLAEANVKARNAKSVVDDKLAESNYDDVMMIFGSHAFWYDYGVVRAPFKTKKKTTEIDKNSGRLKEVSKSVWSMENIHPLNHFFAEDTSFNDMGSGEGDVTWLNRSNLAELKSIRGGQKDAIDTVLKDFREYTYGRQNDEEHKEDNMEDFEYAEHIPVIRVIMRLDRETLSAIFPGEKIKEESSIAEFWCSQDQCLYKQLEPRYVDYNPYRKNGYKIKDLSEIVSSRGIYSILRSTQELIDNAAVNVFSNLQSLPNYITEINRSKLSNADEVEGELETERPIVYTSGAGYRAEFGGNDRAINIINIPNNIDVYITAMREGISIMQQLGFSPFALGQQNQSNVRSTGLGAILQQNANKDFSRFLQAQEDLVESPIAKYIWITEAIEGKDKSIIVDGDVVIQSYTGFLQKDTEAEGIGLFAQNIAALMGQRNALFQSGQDTAWFDNLITQYTEASGFDSGSLPFSPDIGGLAEATSVGGLQDVTTNIGTTLDARNAVPTNINQPI